MRNMVHGTSEIDADDDNQSEVIALQIDPDLKVKSTRTLQRNRNFPTRYVIGLMAFLSAIFAYIVRASFSLNLLAMVNVYDENGTLVEQPDYGPRYDWGAYDQGLLLGAFYYAYTVACIPCGFVLDRFGIGRTFVLVAFVFSALAVLLSPLAASSGTIWWLFGMRLVIGVTQSGTFPNIFRLVSKWAPPAEIGKFGVAVMGSNVGTITAWAIAGPLIAQCGWQWSFYVVGTIVAVFLVLWWWNVYDRPADHPRITPAEREFIELSKPLSTLENSWPPLRQMLVSTPFWALVMLQFSSDWGLYFLMTGVPKFMNQVLGFRISSTGLLATMPYIARTLSAFAFGSLGDWLIQRNYLRKVQIRKGFCVFSHILPAFLMLSVPFVPAEQAHVCVVLMVLTFALNGAVTQTTVANYHDLGAATAASTKAIVTAMSGTSGFLSPLVVAYFTSERNTAAEWRYVFATGASVYLSTALFFVIFGSAQDQNWNKDRKSKRRDDVLMAKEAVLSV